MYVNCYFLEGRQKGICKVILHRLSDVSETAVGKRLAIVSNTEKIVLPQCFYSIL